MTRFAVPLAVASAIASVAVAAAAQAAPAYTQVASIPLGVPDRWDYVVVQDGRVYVAHAEHLAVIDAANAKLVGEVEGIEGGSHGIAASAATGRGYTAAGRGGAVVAFGLKTLKVETSVKVEPDADGMAFDHSSGRLFVIEGDLGIIDVIDAKTVKVTAAIKVGEGMEYGVSDDKGTLYVAGVEKGDLLRIDERTGDVTARWPTPTCQRPHGLALDTARHRAFMGCANSALVVVDTHDGKTVATLPIGKGNDAVAFDPVRKRVIASAGSDGTFSVYAEATPDKYTLVDTVKTVVSGRTLGVDPRSGRIFVPAADIDPTTPPGARPRPLPGTLRVLVYAPTG